MHDNYRSAHHSELPLSPPICTKRSTVRSPACSPDSSVVCRPTVRSAVHLHSTPSPCPSSAAVDSQGTGTATASVEGKADLSEPTAPEPAAGWSGRIDLDRQATRATPPGTSLLCSTSRSCGGKTGWVIDRWGKYRLHCCNIGRICIDTCSQRVGVGAGSSTRIRSYRTPTSSLFQHADRQTDRYIDIPLTQSA